MGPVPIIFMESNNMKKRDTSYSMTQKLIRRYGEKKLYNVWAKLGMYQAASWLSKDMGHWVSPNTVRYLSYKLNWVREVSDHDLPFVKGVLLGSTPEGYYKHVKIVCPSGIAPMTDDAMRLSA